jgi:hypothetical protein
MESLRTHFPLRHKLYSIGAIIDAMVKTINLLHIMILL